MSGLAVLPPLPELAAELVAAGSLAASGAASVWQAAVLAFRAVSEWGRMVQRKQEYRDSGNPEFAEMVNADPLLLELARGNRGVGRHAARLERSNGWSRGNPGPVTRLARWLTASALVPADGVRAMAVNVRDAVARRRKGRKR